MAEPERVTVSVERGVADVRLNRPDKINALDQPMFTALRRAAEGIANDPSVRAVVISGEGRGFCAGLDLTALTGSFGPSDGESDGQSDASPPTREQRAGSITDRLDGRVANWAQQAAYGWTELPVPVIAAIHGVALGGGAQIALAADIRIMAPDARFSILEIRWGLVPDMTGTATLTRLVPLDIAKELTWTGRMVEGEEALRLGLATRVSDDPRKDAMALAAEIAGRNPDAIRAGKRLLQQSGRVPLGQQFLDESAEMGRLIGSPNQMEAVAAWFDKREPVFGEPG